MRLFIGVIYLLYMMKLSNCIIPRPDAVFYDSNRRRMLSITSGNCQILQDRNSISYMERYTPQYSMREIAPQELDYMVSACSVMRRPTESRPNRFIYPGTKWCGSGSQAFGFNDLGILIAEDSCCREHDHCPASLHAGQCRNGICNPSSYTRSHCECDVQFRRCLQRTGSAASHALGVLYFNIARVPCFSELPKPPQRRNARFGFNNEITPCEGPFCNYEAEHPTRYRFHRLSPYSVPFFGYSNQQATVVPTVISNALLTVFRFIGAV